MQRYECRDCGREFRTGIEFSAHFKRAVKSIVVIGCKTMEESDVENRDGEKIDR
jgi:hypothetical protein